MVRRLSGLAILPFAVVPKPGMRPEEDEDEDQQSDHEFGGNVQLRIFGKIMAVRMGAKRGKSRCRLMHTRFFVVMALLAGFHPILRRYPGFRVIDGPDVVAAMTIGAAGCIGVAETVDLPMIGVSVALEIFFVAAATGIHVGNLERIRGSVDDAVNCMAVGAYRGLDVALVE